VQPSLNLDYERVFTAGENATLRTLGNYTLFGPGLDLYAWGLPSTMLEKFSANASYRLYHNTQSRPDPLSNLQTSLNYYPLNNQNFSVSFTYTVGKNLSTLASQKEYVLGLGIKY
jgi:hypothetical protein